MKREGNLSVYMDGLFESSMLATNFRQLSGACMYLGAKGYTIAQTETVNNYFKGGMDEFRFGIYPEPANKFYATSKTG